MAGILFEIRLIIDSQRVWEECGLIQLILAGHQALGELTILEISDQDQVGEQHRLLRRDMTAVSEVDRIHGPEGQTPRLWSLPV